MGCTASNSSVKAKNKQKTAKISAATKQLRQQYKINPKLLGSGGFGKVYQAQSKHDQSHQVAIKVISKQKLKSLEIKELQEEVQILQTLDHPNIVKYYESYEDDKFIYLVMELCSGGELFEKITSETEPMFENRAAVIMKKLFLALQHCHSQNIVHRDIKPCNIMFGNDSEVKFIDFGLARQTIRDDQKMHTVAGTPYFISPDVLSGSYGKQCDIWSLGVVLYVLLIGQYPFTGNSRAEIFKKIKNGDFTSKRITSFEALQHPWLDRCLRRQEGFEKILDIDVMRRLKHYRGSSSLKKAALNLLVKMLKPKEIDSLRQEFQKIDIDNSGMIEILELEQALKNSNFNLTHEQIQQLLSELDYSGNQKVNYTEFIAATIQVKDFLTHQKLEALFSQFDVDGNDEITVQNIRDAMKKIGKEISDEEIAEIMDKHDLSRDQVIQIDEFKRMMLEDQFEI